MCSELRALFRRGCRLNEPGFDFEERLVIRERGAVDEKDVLGPFAERGDARGLQVDAVEGEHFGDAVEEAGAVCADDVENPGPAAFVGKRRHDRAGGKVSRASRELALRGGRKRTVAREKLHHFPRDSRGERLFVPAFITVGDEKGVERPAVAGRVHARVDDRETAFAERSHGPQEEVLAVGQVEKDENAAHALAAPHLDDGGGGVHARCERSRVPGDFLWRMPHEVDDVELAPEGFSDLISNRVSENFERPCLAFGLRVLGRNGRVLALQHGEGRVIERFEKLSLPGRPDLGARRTDVGDGEKVKGVKPRLGRSYI